MRCVAFAVSAVSAVSAFVTAYAVEPAYLDTSLGFADRAADLVSRLTIEEKVSQMMNNAPAVERLGIPRYNWWNEGLHGVARTPYRTTSYPQAIALAATWDVDGIRLVGSQVADEGRAIYHHSRRTATDDIYRGLTYWSPNINIFRDPRWGRGQETYGEDPFLTSRMGEAFVNGLQGDHPRYLKAAACAKHYAVHSGPEWNRHTFNARVSEQDLWDTYLPAFEHLVCNASVAGVMCAYNQVQGQVCCGNDAIMTDILRNRWGFTGYVTSDCGAIDDFYKTHRLYSSAAEASADGVLHGTDCECGTSYRSLCQAIADGLVTEADLDVSLRRLFEIRMRLGMFDPPEMVPWSATSVDTLECAAHAAHALTMARESIVLLKNDDNLLPINQTAIRKIAVVGPNADNAKLFLGNYYGFPSRMQSALEAVRQSVGPGVEVIYEKGSGLVDNLVFTSEDMGVFEIGGQKGFKVDYYDNPEFMGIPSYTAYEDRIEHYWGMGETIADGVEACQMSAVWTSTFTPHADGEVWFYVSADDWARLLIDGHEPRRSGLTDRYYCLDARKGQHYHIELDYVQRNENADVMLSCGMLSEANPADVALRVADADVILYFGGISPLIEGEQIDGVEIDGFRGGDRTSIELPEAQEQLVKALHATGRPLVFVLMSGSAVALPLEDESVSAILCAWYGGQAGAQAIADVILGSYNPSGRLPVTFYRSTDDLPDFENYSMENRTYRYFKGKPLWGFGHGLSYTHFAYSDLDCDMTADGGLKVSVMVENVGQRDGDEVVQLYVANERNFAVPMRSLMGFRRISVPVGERRRVEFLLNAADLTVVGPSGVRIPMVGRVKVSVGGSQPGPDTAQAVMHL